MIQSTLHGIKQDLKQRQKAGLEVEGLVYNVRLASDRKPVRRLLHWAERLKRTFSSGVKRIFLARIYTNTYANPGGKHVSHKQ